MPDSTAAAGSPGRSAPAPGGAAPSLRALGGRVLDLAFPARCAGCGVEGAAICGRCRGPLFALLARPGGTLLVLGADIPMPMVQLESCAPFEGIVRNALHQLKYSGERRLAEVLGQAL